MKKLITPAVLLLIILTVGSCKKNTEDNDDNNSPYSFGWDGEDNPNTVPQSVPATFGAGTLPASVDLIPKFPPIGDQGQYGTCVAWAAGYNLKTVINGMDRGLNTSQLQASNNQFSAKYLFTALPDAQKGADCNGTDFVVALDEMLNNGVATQQTVPYSNLGGCSRSGLQSSWTTEAAGHKIKNYRRIALDVNEIKTYLSNNVPVLFGAKLADNFMQWNSDDVISSNTSFDQVGQHAYHAMTLSGYDDAKGPNGAFQVMNSWGTNWGNVGKVWVDYNFFVNTFCFNNNVFIATNSEGSPTPPSPDPVQNGNVDLAAWAFQDNSTNNSLDWTERNIEFNIYNIGTQTALASTGWAIYYIYYSAYNSSDYGILIVDEAGVHFTEDIPGGSDLAAEMFGTTAISQTYTVPTIVDGEYYLCLYADPYDMIPEQDESNNYFYTTNQYPVTFTDGVVFKTDNEKPVKSITDFSLNNPMQPGSSNLKGKQFRTSVNAAYPNAYTPEEIKQRFKIERQSGRWQAKVNEFLATHPSALAAKMAAKNSAHK